MTTRTGNTLYNLTGSALPTQEYLLNSFTDFIEKRYEVKVKCYTHPMRPFQALEFRHQPHNIGAKRRNPWDISGVFRRRIT